MTNIKRRPLVHTDTWPTYYSRIVRTIVYEHSVAHVSIIPVLFVIEVLGDFLGVYSSNFILFAHYIVAVFSIVCEHSVTVVSYIPVPFVIEVLGDYLGV